MSTFRACCLLEVVRTEDTTRHPVSMKKSGAAISENPSLGAERSTAPGFVDSIDNNGANVNIYSAPPIEAVQAEDTHITQNETVAAISTNPSPEALQTDIMENQKIAAVCSARIISGRLQTLSLSGASPVSGSAPSAKTALFIARA